MLCEGGLHIACDGVFYEDTSVASRRCDCDCHDDVVELTGRRDREAAARA